MKLQLLDSDELAFVANADVGGTKLPCVVQRASFWSGNLKYCRFRGLHESEAEVALLRHVMAGR